MKLIRNDPLLYVLIQFVVLGWIGYDRDYSVSGFR